MSDDRVLVQAWITKRKHPVLYAWATTGNPDKSEAVRVSLMWFLELKPKLDKIEAMLIELVERRNDETMA